MAKRGRQSAAELKVVAATSQDVERSEAVEPPQELTQDQSEVWRQIVDRVGSKWFPRETHEMLAQYCRHAVAQKRVGELIAAYESRDSEDFDIEEYDRLLKMQEREGRALSSLATRMRITQQATYDPKKKKPKTVPSPWES